MNWGKTIAWKLAGANPVTIVDNRRFADIFAY
jgi:hypothetical protein